MTDVFKTDTPLVVPKDTIKRLIKDVREIRKNPLDSNGIYYKHDDENMLCGYALIVGTEDTVYADGYYFFEINFPVDYPYRPPKVSFKTNQDHIRFHPNLYTSGKVCLSMLNTWRGEQWTSCQTISSILLTMCTLFTNNPLLSEPGVDIKHPDIDGYNDIIEYKNIEIATLNVISKHPSLYLPMFDLFRDVVLERFIENRDRILKRVTALSRDKICRVVVTRMYSFTVVTDYDKLVKQFHKVDNAFGSVSKDVRTDIVVDNHPATKIDSG